MCTAFRELLGKSGKGESKKNIAIHALKRAASTPGTCKTSSQVPIVTAWTTTEHAFYSSCGLQNDFLLPHASSSSCDATNLTSTHILQLQQ
jgi:hypothetical protein